MTDVITHPVDDDPETLGIIARLRTARAALKHWGIEEDECRDALVKLAGVRNRLDLTVAGRAILKIERRTSRRFDSLMFKSDHPDLYDAYRREVISTYVTAAGEVRT